MKFQIKHIDRLSPDLFVMKLYFILNGFLLSVKCMAATMFITLWKTIKRQIVIKKMLLVRLSSYYFFIEVIDPKS